MEIRQRQKVAWLCFVLVVVGHWSGFSRLKVVKCVWRSAARTAVGCATLPDAPLKRTHCTL